MKTGSSEALIGWEFGKTTVGPNGGSVAMEYLWVWMTVKLVSLGTQGDF
jgi:hypothetical protein